LNDNFYTGPLLPSVRSTLLLYIFVILKKTTQGASHSSTRTVWPYYVIGLLKKEIAWRLCLHLSPSSSASWLSLLWWPVNYYLSRRLAAILSL